LIAELKFSVSFIGNVIKAALDIFPKLINWCKRPKANIEIKNQNIIFKDSKGKESHVFYPCILISFTKDVKIDVRSIKINNESLSVMLSRDSNHLRQNQNSQEPHTVVNARIMPFVYENWQHLTQRACHFDIKAHEQEVFPLYLKESMSHTVFSHKKKPRVFFPKKNIVLSLNVNGTDYEYSIPLLKACQVIINNMAFN